ncbi:hypothetical protein AB0K60_03475 [Thermopolyspora sp. NPDC052614]|uniref:hypothetical protein n=1 Tax=Thermopolyspora sp. NPDC052614 TaxID=3155682 RepID=UPI003423985A
MRRHFNDPLLVRSGNTSELSPLAQALRLRTAHALNEVERVFASEAVRPGDVQAYLHVGEPRSGHGRVARRGQPARRAGLRRGPLTDEVGTRPIDHTDELSRPRARRVGADAGETRGAQGGSPDLSRVVPERTGGELECSGELVRREPVA